MADIPPKIPFCRRGHAQITGESTAGNSIYVFGGVGIDYSSRNDGGFLADLWRLEIRTSSGFQWTQTSPSPGLPWPRPRKNFGACATQREGWLLVHGGETKADAYAPDLGASILGDFWLRKNDGWVNIGSAGLLSASAAVPTARRNHALTVLPVSGQLFLLGGEAVSTSASTRKSGGAVESYVECGADAWLLHINAVIDSLASSSDSGPLESKARVNTSTSWQQVASFPAVNARQRCFEGFSATGVVDTFDGGSEEAVFVFGGRTTEGGAWRRRLSNSEGLSSAAALMPQRRSGNSTSKPAAAPSTSNREGQLAYSSDVHLFHPATNTWTKLTPPPTGADGPVSPVGRDKHAALYVRELDTVFITGGRSSVAFNASAATDEAVLAGGDRQQQSASAGAHSSAGESGAYTIMDLWGYNLTSRTWRRYLSPDNSNRGSMRRLNDRPLAPVARYEHTMSLWRGASGQDTPQIILFGGQHELRRSSIGGLRRRLMRQLDKRALDQDSETTAKHGTSWGIVTDDDTGVGAIGIHSQLNDVWAVPLSGNVGVSSVGAWRLVSVGGCSAGDSGLLSDKPVLDMTAVSFVVSVAAAFLVGVAAHRLLKVFQKWMRGGEYESIHEDSSHAARQGGIELQGAATKAGQ